MQSGEGWIYQRYALDSSHKSRSPGLYQGARFEALQAFSLKPVAPGINSQLGRKRPGLEWAGGLETEKLNIGGLENGKIHFQNNRHNEAPQ